MNLSKTGSSGKENNSARKEKLAKKNFFQERLRSNTYIT